MHQEASEAASANIGPPPDGPLGPPRSPEPLATAVDELVERLREPMGLDRWTLYLHVAAIETPETASCAALPEYKSATLTFDPEKLRTGDDLGEIVAHEMSHCITWPTFKLAEDNALLAAGLVPKYLRKALRTKLMEEARQAGEDVTTQVGFLVIRILRRLWTAEAKAKTAEAEVKVLRRKLRDAEKFTTPTSGT